MLAHESEIAYLCALVRRAIYTRAKIQGAIICPYVGLSVPRDDSQKPRGSTESISSFISVTFRFVTDQSRNGAFAVYAAHDIV